MYDHASLKMKIGSEAISSLWEHHGVLNTNLDSIGQSLDTSS